MTPSPDTARTPMAVNDWTHPDDGGEFVPTYFTLGCIGCDSDAAAQHEEDAWMDDEDEDEDAPRPLDVTLQTDWCFECGRKLDSLGWLNEHLDRLLWRGDDCIDTALMIKERLGNPELNAWIDQRLAEVGEAVVSSLNATIEKLKD